MNALISIVLVCASNAHEFLELPEEIKDEDVSGAVSLRALAKGQPGKCVHPKGNTCVCIHPSYPCYRWNPKRNSCTCSGIQDAGYCKQIGGSMCERPKDCVPNCETCKDGSTCQTCEAGFQGVGGKCANKTEIFAKVKHARKGNLVMLGSEDLFGALKAGYEGTTNRVDAVDLALRAFHHFYKDVFDFVVVYPGERLKGRVSHAENFHLDPEPGSNPVSKLRSVVTMQLYGHGTSAVPLLHELEHEWGIFGDVEKLTPTRLRTAGPHWGMTAFDRMGMLGGFPRSAVTCTAGTLGEDTCKQPLKWDFSKGSTMRSHDEIGGYSKFDLQIMGLMTPEEMEGEKLVFCEGPSHTRGRGITEVTCKKVHTITPTQLEAVLENKDKRLKTGEHLRVAILTVLPSAAAVETEAATPDFAKKSGLGWLNDYVGKEPERFHKYTLERASMSIGATEADESGYIEDKAEDTLAEAAEALEDSEKTMDSAEEEVEEYKGPPTPPVPKAGALLARRASRAV